MEYRYGEKIELMSVRIIDGSRNRVNHAVTNQIVMETYGNVFEQQNQVIQIEKELYMFAILCC